MAMDVARTPSLPQNTSPQSEAPRGRTTDPTEAEEQARANRNAVNTFQARYGEKPKEARQIKKSLDKDDFLKIMITEMQHQDPTKPMDAEKMSGQMAQLTSVEQLKNVGTAIEKLAEKDKASDRLAMSAMIGKTVTVDKGRFTHQKGTLSPVNFDLPADAEKVKLLVLNDRGEEIATRDLEPMKAGSQVYNWDGVNSSNIQVPGGAYSVRVDAEDAKGNKISVNPISKEAIVGVTFEGGETNFLVGDSKAPQKVSFKSVTRIEGDVGPRPKSFAPAQDRVQSVGEQASLAAGAGAQAAEGAENVAAAPSASNMPFDLPPELKEKFKSQMAALAPQAPAVEEAPVKAEGFPSGLGGE